MTLILKKPTVFLLGKLQVLANPLLESLTARQLPLPVLLDHVKKKIFNFSPKSELDLWA